MNMGEIAKDVLGLCGRGLALVALGGFIVFAGLGWYLEFWIVQQDQKALGRIVGRYAGLLFLIGVLTNLTAACLIYWTLSEKIFKDFKALENEAGQNDLANRVAAAVEGSYQAANTKLTLAMVGAVQTK